MASSFESLIWKRETAGTFPAFTVPNRRTPVNSMGFTGGATKINLMDTDSKTRSKRSSVRGSVNYTSTLNMPFYPTGFIPNLLRSIFTDSVSTLIGSAGSKNDMLIDEDVQQLPWFTVQHIYRPTYANNGKGLVLNGITFNVALNEVATVDADFIVNDSAPTGENWADGTAAPAVISIGSTTIDDPLPRPFRHFNAEMYQGGTLAKTGNAVTLTGGTLVSCLQNFSLAFAFNVEGIQCIKNGDGTISNTFHGERAITISTDMNWYIENSTFWARMRDGVPTSLKVEFISQDKFEEAPDFNYKYTFIFPRLQIAEGQADIPALTGDKARRTQTVTFEVEENYQDPNFDGDVALSIESDENLTT